eukprot:CAMPEP_0113582432 /NCGR_PEP_ID=MMETSP0015_2-20120614/31911_1 /TAXON_ID=2838 /ORGANISM="Odontella" /LENGTH=219 /DNA_ID=CAMNT_0000487103 /DNA_START=121 /DNA_END=776 /DNA_ORIENTATION=- /assembly_acc=CAM_ASM_000160
MRFGTTLRFTSMTPAAVDANVRAPLPQIDVHAKRIEGFAFRGKKRSNDDGAVVVVVVVAAPFVVVPGTDQSDGNAIIPVVPDPVDGDLLTVPHRPRALAYDPLGAQDQILPIVPLFASFLAIIAGAVPVSSPSALPPPPPPLSKLAIQYLVGVPQFLKTSVEVGPEDVVRRARRRDLFALGQDPIPPQPRRAHETRPAVFAAVRLEHRPAAAAAATPPP